MDEKTNKVEVILEKDLKEIENYGNIYIKEILEGRLKAMGWTEESLLENWWHSFIFICDRSFYQGRSDQLSKKFEDKTIEILKNFLGDSIKEKTNKLIELEKSGHLDISRIAIIRNDLKQIIGKKVNLDQIYDILIKDNVVLQELEVGFSGKGKRNDRLMTLNFLMFMKQKKYIPLVKYFKDLIELGKIKKAYDKLVEIISVDNKIACLILRDIAFLYNLEDKFSVKDWVYLQPMDVWVERLAYAMMNKAIKDNGLSPSKFNAGAWYLLSKSNY